MERGRRCGPGITPVVTVAVAICALTGCTAGTSDVGRLGPSLQALSSAQAAEISTGNITFDVYQTAFRRYQACMDSAGYSVEVLGISHKVYDYQLTADAANSPEQHHCYSFEFEQVDNQWQLANEDTSETAEIMAACLSAHGIAVPETLEARLEALRQAHIDPASC